MVDRQFVPEHPLQTGGKLCGESYFGNKVENLSALFQYRVDEMYVYLGPLDVTPCNRTVSFWEKRSMISLYAFCCIGERGYGLSVCSGLLESRLISFP